LLSNIIQTYAQICTIPLLNIQLYSRKTTTYSIVYICTLNIIHEKEVIAPLKHDRLFFSLEMIKLHHEKNHIFNKNNNHSTSYY